MLNGFRFPGWATRSNRRNTKTRHGVGGLSLRQRRLLMEPLEARLLLSVVTNATDSGAGSLRAAILAAAAGDTITFSAGLVGPITLTSGVLEISEPLTIQGPGAGQLTVNGTHDGIHGVFQVDAGIRNVQISGLTVEAASSYDPIANDSGYLNVASCTLSGYDGINFDAKEGGSLTVSNSNLSGNADSGIYFSGDKGAASVPVGVHHGLQHLQQLGIRPLLL
jgi:hypothetical protein